MREKDLVYVNWPTGRGGPYKTINYDPSDVNETTVKVIVPINTAQFNTVTVPEIWCEFVPDKKKYEPDRLVYFWDDDNLGPLKRGIVRHYRDITPERWDHVEPIHTRWDELTEHQRNIVKGALNIPFGAKSLYKIIYKKITGEIHP